MRLISKGHLAVIHAASTDQTRDVLNGVKFEETDKGMRAIATGGRLLAMYESETMDIGQFPDIPAMNDVPNSATVAIVPLPAVVKVKKGMPKGRRLLPILGNALIKMGKDQTTFASTDLENATVTPTKNIEGNFPDYGNVIPKDEITKVSVKLAIDLLQDALNIAKEGGFSDLTFHVSESLLAVKMTAENSDGKLIMVQMPLR